MPRQSRRPTVSDVARLSGVSPATVSYVLNKSPGQKISAATSERVRRAAEQLGYVPNAAASTLRRGHSRVVLVVIDTLNVGHTNARSVEPLVEAITSCGLTALTYSLTSEDDLLGVVRTLQPFAVATLAFTSGAVRQSLLAVGARHVIGLNTAEGEDLGPARPGEAAIGRTQVRHLVGRGRGKIVYVIPDGSPRLPIARARLRGAQEECAHQGLSAPLVLSLPMDRRAMADALSSLASLRGAGGVAASDDRMGIAVLGAMADVGWSAPGDLAVVGADNFAESAFAVPALTSVYLPLAGLRAVAAEWLSTILAADGPPTDHALLEWDEPAEIVVRQSS
ncbi:LacI family DNA-binding transcriptional regulator [Streptomyces sp. NPDC056987]|uniref:LacI family DNA-binding transcriptional regulator n=1 Tax=Streptomyces sp. NPDC056987 TaxID=3345988 RepID=UPI00362FB373